MISGALPGFKTGYKSAMYTNTMSRTIHIADVGIADRHLANNAYERFNWKIKDRTARVRGFNSGDPPLVRLLLPITISYDRTAAWAERPRPRLPTS